MNNNTSTSYRDIIAEKIPASSLMNMDDYKERNNNKSWEYRRYSDIDPNFICISKDGTLGEIWKVGGLIIGLPSSKGKDILNINEPDRRKRKWKRTEIPSDFQKIEVEYKRQMRRIKGIKRQGIKDEYIAKRDELVNGEYKEFVSNEFYKRKHGLFVKIDNQVHYLTGENYMFLNYYYLAEDKMYPNFRITAMHTWWHWEAVCADQNNWGELRLKSRRVSWTSESASIALNKLTITRFAEIPVVSENDRLAKKLFTKKIVNPFTYYPAYFKPLIEDPNDKAKSSLEIIFETDHQETSEISTYPTKDVAYDSTKATFSINDEVGKYINVVFTEYRGNHKDCHFKGATIVSKGRFGSTAGEFSIGGESFKYEFEQADPKKRDKLGSTGTGLIALFVDDCFTLAGFFDEWGYPIVYDPKEPILNEENVYIEYGAITWWNNEHEKKKKGKKSDLNNFLRQHPRTVENAFRDDSGANNDFDIDNLNDHDEYLNTLSDDELDRIILKGNLVWEGEEYVSDVIWRPNKNGNIHTTWIPDKELRNSFSKKMFHGRELNFPDNSYIGCFGVDSYDISQTVDGEGSKGCIVGYSRYNMSGAPSHSFFLHYLKRPDKRDDFYDDVIKICKFFGMFALIENNKPRLLEYMNDKGFRGYSLTRPDKKWKYLSQFEKDCGGIPSSTQGNKDQASLLKDHILDFIGGEDIEKNCNCYFQPMIKEFKKFDVNKRKKFDTSVSCGLALLGSQYKIKKRKTVNIDDNSKGVGFDSFSA